MRRALPLTDTARRASPASHKETAGEKAPAFSESIALWEDLTGRERQGWWKAEPERPSERASGVDLAARLRADAR